MQAREKQGNSASFASSRFRVDIASAAGQGRDRTVLIIDDEESARDLAARSLVRLGFSVRVAASGEEGLDFAWVAFRLLFIRLTTIVSERSPLALASIWSSLPTGMCWRPLRFASRARRQRGWPTWRLTK